MICRDSQSWTSFTDIISPSLFLAFSIYLCAFLWVSVSVSPSLSQSFPLCLSLSLPLPFTPSHSCSTVSGSLAAGSLFLLFGPPFILYIQHTIVVVVNATVVAMRTSVVICSHVPNLSASHSQSTLALCQALSPVSATRVFSSVFTARATVRMNDGWIHINWQFIYTNAIITNACQIVRPSVWAAG